jgi:hypothetical protein
MKSHTKFLSSVAKKLDIQHEEYNKAVKITESLAHHLSNDPNLSKHEPKIYMQGSFRLGTVVRPIIDGSEYDVDLVCELSDSEEAISQDQLKEAVGDALSSHPEYGKHFKLNQPSERCWTVGIDKKFKIDVVPAIPKDIKDDNKGILIQGKEDGWKETNPKGFYNWFQSKNAQYKSILDASVDVNNLEGMQKSVLQQVVQILKRLRDVKFEDNPKLKPSSIVITALAAENYKGETNVYEALYNIVKELKKYDGSQEISIGENEENLADRLNKRADLRKAFCDWIEYIDERCSSLKMIDSLEFLQEFSISGFGHSLSSSVFEKEDFGLKNKAINIHYPEAKIVESEAPKPWVKI